MLFWLLKLFQHLLADLSMKNIRQNATGLSIARSMLDALAAMGNATQVLCVPAAYLLLEQRFASL
eukprot:CAMPEP_0172720792 /NCGR_PEP_ID=MMETSP1074-20121228/77692_1 /TAXON_ID=2916 /ORGANISM="Ceratium fusus, Strain PA161109" /LENGTH=64 /DNA_ID=CAMNT_0013546377 /DNA_START=57 /DNA_END=251 /DNA_ORIENTATION=+